MKSLRVLLAVVFVLIFPAGLSAQTHVSQLRAEARNNLIRLTWTDSPDARGPVYIFRSARPFSGSVPPNIRPVIVNYGERAYIDEADDLVNLFYFIAASDTSGQRYDLIIPYVNIINVSLVDGSFTGSAADNAVVSGPDPARETQAAAWQIPSAAAVNPEGIKAIQEGEKVIVTYTTKPGSRAILYRSLQPIMQPQDLLNSVILQTRFSSQFIDYPVPGLPCYYAVIYEEEITEGSIGIVLGVNSTAFPVSIPADVSLGRSLRSIPLPLMTLPDTGGSAQRSELSDGSVNMLEALHLPAKAVLAVKEPRVFIADMQIPSENEDPALFHIMNNYFKERDWEGSYNHLRSFLTIPRSNEVEIRAHFYLAQCQYFLGNYKEALFEFLLIKTHLEDEVNSWIDAVLSAMIN